MGDAKPPAILAAEVAERSGTGYPEPYRAEVAQRFYRRLSDAFGLTQFGVNVTRLAPGAWSSQRHWHRDEDEFVYVLDGEPTLVTDAGRQRLAPGMIAGFKAGAPDGHHFVNETDRDVTLLVVGTRTGGDRAFYPDIDLEFRGDAGQRRFLHKDGTPW